MTSSKFHGTLLLASLFAIMFGLLTSGNEPTGFAIKEIETQNIIQEENKIKSSCIGNIQHESCSFTKPLYCDDGSLVYNCYECGCNEGETCGEQGVCNEIKKCADGSFYGECSTLLNGKFCDEGNLIPYCDLCSCKEGYTCEDNKCVRQ